MKNKLTTIALAVTLGLAGAVYGQTIFTLADTDDMNLSHVTGSELTPPGNLDLGNGVFTYGALSTDTTANTAAFSSGLFTSSDWGGVGTFTSDAIDVSLLTSINIAAQFDGLFNVNTEFSNFFYQLDANPIVEFGFGVEGTTHSNEVVNVGSIDVSSATNLVVGFTYSHNGASDFFNVDSLAVSAVPEPSAYALLAGLLGLAWVALSRRQA